MVSLSLVGLASQLDAAGQYRIAPCAVAPASLAGMAPRRSARRCTPLTCATLGARRRTRTRAAQPHLSAASGLVCAHGRAYVVADDEHHLAVFRDLRSPGTLHRIRAGDLPDKTKARKRRKPDLETLLSLPALGGRARWWRSAPVRARTAAPAS